MKRRAFLGILGMIPLAGCGGLLASEQQAETGSVEFERDDIDGVGIFHDEERLGRVGILQQPHRLSSYQFTFATSPSDGLEIQSLSVEFAFPDEDIRPPDLYLEGDTEIPIASLNRSLSTEYTTLEITESVDGIDLDFIAVPHDEQVGDIPLELNFTGEISNNGFTEKVYSFDGSFSTALEDQE